MIFLGGWASLKLLYQFWTGLQRTWEHAVLTVNCLCFVVLVRNGGKNVSGDFSFILQVFVGFVVEICVH